MVAFLVGYGLVSFICFLFMLTDVAKRIYLDLYDFLSDIPKAILLSLFWPIPVSLMLLDLISIFHDNNNN